MNAETLAFSRALALLDKNLTNSETLCGILAGQLARRRREVNEARLKLATLMQAPPNPVDPRPGQVSTIQQPNRLAGLLKSG